MIRINITIKAVLAEFRQSSAKKVILHFKNPLVCMTDLVIMITKLKLHMVVHDQQTK